MEIKPAKRRCLARKVSDDKGLPSGTEGCKCFYFEINSASKGLAFLFFICYVCTFEMLSTLLELTKLASFYNSLLDILYKLY